MHALKMMTDQRQGRWFGHMSQPLRREWVVVVVTAFPS